MNIPVWPVFFDQGTQRLEFVDPAHMLKRIIELDARFAPLRSLAYGTFEFDWSRGNMRIQLLQRGDHRILGLGL